MGPKIEELPDDYDVTQELNSSAEANSRKKSKKPAANPFASTTKKATIKRDPSEVYPKRKGLNKPEFSRDEPIDKLFEKLEQLLNLPLEELSISVLNQRIFERPLVSSSRYEVTNYLLDQLLDIQKCSMEKKFKDKSIISISLHDIKTFSKLVNVIIILGIYPALNHFNIGVPFEKRRLKELNSKKPIQVEKLSNRDESISLLDLIYEKFFIIFQIKSDVTDLLSKGTGVSDFITIAIALNTIPGISHEPYSIQYKDIQKIPETFELFQIYTLLINTPSPSYYKQFVFQHLQVLHYNAPNGDGVLALIEFVLGIRDQEDIDIAKFDHVTSVILSKPKDINTEAYFTSIGNQFYSLLVNINRPAITSCVTYVIEKLWDRNQLIVKDFLLKRLWNNFNPTINNNDKHILVTEAELNNAINVLISLSRKGLIPDLYQAVMEPIILSLWAYYLSLKRNGKSVEVITNILTSYFTVMVDFDDNKFVGLDLIAKNLIYEGGDDWEYTLGPNGLMEIVKKKPIYKSESSNYKINKFIEDLDFCCSNFMKLLENVDLVTVQALFISILKTWLKSGDRDTIMLGEEDESPYLKLIDLKILENIGEKFKESLARTPFEMLEIAQSFLDSKLTYNDSNEDVEMRNENYDSDDEDNEENQEEILPVLLELLSAILSEQDVVIDDQSRELLNNINNSLVKLRSRNINTNLKKSIESLQHRITNFLTGVSPPANELDAQKQVLQRAITSLNDPLVPIRAHGLYLLRQLIRMKSEVISLDFVVNLHLVQLKDPEPFVYLNVIKGLESLIEWDELPVLKILLEIYTNKDNDLDERLRIGEVILRYIQLSNEKFNGESAQLIVESCLTIIRRHEGDDDRMRMSAMSLLGMCCKVNPLGLVGSLGDALDCAIGILNLETSSEKSIMRRSAITLIQDLILGTSETDKVIIPNTYKEKIVTLLRYISVTDTDLFTREQAQRVLELIEELATSAMELYTN
ncbi:uncharacterized protein KGF55_005010 [Candida pseudojiufengensis]|uniref:uncharacterized protein n=1 Tax=Candida pseudojiufengensis TaxID=497109 RepID=UPI002225374D|nr:uncharacterized protein KGF55_005010 [Candida pseudojiufengensis]KAI5959778.1 hypothetical protein KGF55_005010 [Candida pseudojiufengensis]